MFDDPGLARRAGAACADAAAKLDAMAAAGARRPWWPARSRPPAKPPRRPAGRNRAARPAAG